MTACAYYDKDEIGVRYASLKDRSLLLRSEANLTEVERILREELLAFEEHYFECDECHERLRQDQEIWYAFSKLHTQGAVLEKAGPKRSYGRWLSLAASFGLLSVISFSALYYWVKQPVPGTYEVPGQTDVGQPPGGPSQFYLLEPAPQRAPVERSGSAQPVQIPSGSGAFSLGAALPKEIMESHGLDRVIEDTTSLLRSVDDLIPGDVLKELAESRRFRLRVVDAEGRERLSKTDAPVDEKGRLSLRLEDDFLEPGSYDLELRIIDRRNSQEQQLVRFPFVIR